MRDLLTDLVRRTRRPESTVQPRLPSAYEAMPPAMHDLGADQDIVTRVPAASPPPLSVQPHSQPAPTPRVGEPHDSPAVVTSATRSIPPPPRDTDDHASRHAPVAAAASSNVLGRNAQLASTSAPERVPGSVVATAQATPPHVPAVSVVPQEARAQALAPIPPTTRVELPQIRRLRTEPRREDPANAREQPAPEIRISIGRIEVRATAAERPPARRQPSSAPPLTLDEYLATRARRGTR